MKYNHLVVEPKWQKAWEEKGCFHAEENSDKKKFYALIEFPYPSGQGLHVGHPRPYTALDVVSRKRRLQGYNVLYPIGWDAFGLPTENYAIKNHIHPEIVTKNNVARFKKQIQSLGISFDWSREINTTDPEYYKWTQWIFLQLFKHGLAYKKEMAVNWCTSCKCVLANEEVVNGVCERCGSEVVRKVKSQWMLKITEYADRLIKDLDLVDYPDRVKAQQKNWIGKSTGAEVDFNTTEGDKLTVYTTRCDTLFGATYMVISPEHPCIEKWNDKIKNIEDVKAYQVEAAKKSDFERTELVKEKTGVMLDGVKAINPVNGKEIPIFVSDYVLVSYGTGAIMAVPAHDTRDWEFAKKFNLPIIEVVKGGEDVQKEAFTDCATGVMVNSDFLTGLTVEEAKKKMISWLEENKVGRAKTNYKLRDWVFSRQRYWGEPIPIVHLENGDMVVIDFEGMKDGVPFEGGKAENYNLAIGSGNFIPGFEEQIVGHKTGEEFTITVKFPEDYQAEELKGADAEFKINLHEIKRKELPELDDEFVKDVSEKETLDEYKEEVKETVKKRLEDEQKKDIEDQVITKLCDAVEGEIPEQMYDNAVNEMIQEFDMRLRSQGMDFNTYMEYMGATPDTIKEMYRPDAEKRVKLRLALEKIAEKEAIEVTEADLDAEYTRLADQYNMKVEDVKKAINDEALSADLKTQKAMDLAVNSVKAESKKAAEDKKED